MPKREVKTCMSFDMTDVPEKNRAVNRVSDDSSSALFTSSLPADGIFGTRPSSPWASDVASPTSPFQNLDMKATSPFQNADKRSSAPITDTTNGAVWRAGFQEASFVKPTFGVRPNPWDRTPNRPAPQGPIDRFPSEPAPQPPIDRFPVPPASQPPIDRFPSQPAPPVDRVPPQVPRPQPAPSNEPWDRLPNSPWNKPAEPSTGNGGPWDKGPWGKDGGVSNPGKSANASDAAAAFQRDQVSRTSYSFNECVVSNKALGKENEVALEMKMRDWIGKQKDMNPIVHMRGTASLACALGEFRLEEGSRIDLTSHQNDKPRILKGQDYDFGGEANIWLRMSAGSLVAAQQYVIGHKGLTIEGQSMDDAYLQQLKGLQTDVERKLETIYGPHDVEAVYGVVREQVRTKSGDWQQGLVRLKRQLDELKSTDSRFIAKSARDVALGFLAEADYMSSRDNGEEAKIMYQSANQYLAMSQRYDSSAPDNLALAKISERLKPQILKSIDNQWSDPFSNPFELPKPQLIV